MKTVIDVVNDLKADVLNIQNYNEAKKSIRFNEVDEDEYLGFFLSNFDKQQFSYFVCTVDEFNACVDELSAATWINGVSIKEWKAGMKNTVIDSHGNELQLNKVYEFSDNERSWFASAILSLTDGVYQYKSHNTSWRFIRECQLPLGTIKKAPVKLVDNAIYQFKCNGYDWVGMYLEDRDSFFEFARNGNKICGTCEATNAVRLVPETK